MHALPEVGDLLMEVDGFCHPDWNSIRTRIDSTVPEAARNEAWWNVARRWTARLCGQFGPDYRCHDSPNFLLVSSAPAAVIRDARAFCEKARKEILHSLAGVASDANYGPNVVLMVRELERYYAYLAHYYPDGDHPQSGGVFLHGDGFLHVVLTAPDGAFYRASLAHELTHSWVAHLPLPAWLNEALAMRMEDALGVGQGLRLDRERYERHVAHWTAGTIQQFWSGEAWNRDDQGFELAYELARVLWRKIEVDLKARPEDARAFLRDAHANDAGAGAFQRAFGLPLEELVADFLGEGSWRPDPDSWRA